MAKYKIGITECGDAGIDLSWSDRMDSVDGAILITKSITPKFQEAVLKNRDKLIVHATATGFGGSVLEPNAPNPGIQLLELDRLVQRGFPAERTVVRIDPIIPTEKGLYTAQRVFCDAVDLGFSRFRISIIDMYPHVRERFKMAGLPLPYPDGVFSPSRRQIDAVDDLLRRVNLFCRDRPIRVECCAEPGLKNAIRCGCISDKDLALLGLEMDDDEAGYQRKHCMCYSGKTELLRSKSRCSNGCLYCYWR